MVNLITKEVKLANRNVSKIVLIGTKYIPHFGALCYMIYTLFNFCGIDLNIFGSFVHISLLYWIHCLLCSIGFKYCYVHRLPLYYILVNETITNLDYYIHIPIELMNLFMIHAILICLLIFGYTFYYLKNKKKYERL